MTKKMKGAALDSSPYGVFGDSKTMIKHQTLMQEYHELHKDVEATRNKLESMKGRKLTLSAEVRFLRQRYKYLLKSKSPDLPQERGKELTQCQYEQNQRKKSMKVPIAYKKEADRGNLPPVFKANQKGRVYMGQEASLKHTVYSFVPNLKEKQHTGKNAALINHTAISNVNPRGRSYKGKEDTHQSPMLVIDLNQQERIYSRNGAAMRNTASIFDLNNRETAFSGKQQAMLNRAPIFDLNQISIEEEELQDNSEPVRFEELKKGMINEDELGDLKLSGCRNVGESSNRAAAKRNISCQDPVALRV